MARPDELDDFAWARPKPPQDELQDYPRADPTPDDLARMLRATGRPLQREWGDTAKEALYEFGVPEVFKTPPMPPGGDSLVPNAGGRIPENQSYATRNPLMGGMIGGAELLSNLVGTGAGKATAAAATKLTPAFLYGITARTADRAAFARAESMLAKGAHPDEVYYLTGVGPSPEGKLKFEPDTTNFRINEDIKAELFDPKKKRWEGKLDDAVQGTDLFDAYPDMRNYDAKLNYMYGQESGGFGSGRHTMTTPFIRATGGGNESFRRAMGHEITHGVANEERGFARGTRPDADVIQPGHPLWPQYENEVSQLKQIFGDYIPPHITGGLKEKIANKAYDLSAGENAANAVMDRLDLSPKQKRERPFWMDYQVPEADQLVETHANPFASMIASKLRGNPQGRSIPVEEYRALMRQYQK